MKNILMITTVFILNSICFSQNSLRFENHWNELDRLLSEGKTYKVKKLLSSENIEVYRTKMNPIKLNEYLDLVYLVDQIKISSEAFKGRLVSQYLKNEGKYHKKIAGKYASEFYSKFKTFLYMNNLDKAIEYYLLASHFSSLFVQFEKKRLRYNYNVAHKNFKQEKFELAKENIKVFRKEIRISDAYAEIGDSLRFLYNNLDNRIQKKINKKQWWEFEEPVSKQWNLNFSFALNTDKQTNAFHLNFIRKPTKKNGTLDGSERTAFGINCSIQGGYYYLPNCVLGLKMNYGNVFIKKISLHIPATKEVGLDYDRHFISSQFFGRYIFRTHAGARPYADIGIGIRNYWNDEVESPFFILNLDPGEKVYLTKTDEIDPFINLEFGIEYLPNVENNFIYTMFLGSNIVFNNDVNIYRIQFFAGFKIGMLL